MNKVLENSLFYLDNVSFNKISEQARSFNATYNGKNIVQDDIFNVVKNYANHKEFDIEILRYPIKDEDFCACTFIRNGRIFMVANSYLPICKQIFAVAHELFHIIGYIGGENVSFLNHGSILKASNIDETTTQLEDREANAFAGLFLCPSDALVEQANIYGIFKDNIELTDILKLMDIFGIPYKAMVLRLLEEGYLSSKKAIEFLDICNGKIEFEINLTGISKRWQRTCEEIIEFGSLEQYMFVNEKMSFVTDSRLEGDRKIISQIKDKLYKEA